MLKITLLDGYNLNQDLDWQPLKDLGDCDLYDRTPVNNPKEILSRIGQAEIVITHKTPITAEIIQKAPNLAYIGVMGDGYDVIDTQAARKRGIPVTNIPVYATDAVAQATFALLLEIANQVGLHSQLVHNGQWSAGPEFTFWQTPLIALKGKTLGLIGYGRIAQKVTEIANAFSMTVLFYNHRPTPHNERLVQQVSLSDLLHQSDIVSLHVRLTPETTNLIRQETIQEMKPGVILLNTARGKLINETDLANALKSGQISAVGLDVAQQEPIRSDSPLLTAQNCFITPHIAWTAQETRASLLTMTINNLRAFLAGHTTNVVN